MKHATSLLLSLALCGAAFAQDDDIQTVPVEGVRKPEMKSYRAVWAGLETFERQHRLAPDVPQLRFRVVANRAKCIGMCHTSDNGLSEEDGSTLALRIASDDFSIPVPVSPQGIFSVPRSEAAYDANADLIFNRKKGQYKIGANVRTPGLADNVRRLGDLRLECKVEVAIAKEEIPFWIVALANTVLLTTDWCMTNKGDVSFSYQAEQPLRSATLTDGERSLKLAVHKRSYKVPLGNQQWSDSALITLEYAAQ